MKRWLVRICVLLVFGAIVNVAVAWGSAVWPWRSEHSRWHMDSFHNWPAPGDDPGPLMGYTVYRWVSPIHHRVLVYFDDSYRAGFGKGTASFEQLIPDWGRDWLDVPPERNPLNSNDEWETQKDRRIVESRGWPVLSLWCGLRIAPPLVLVNGRPVPRHMDAMGAIAIDDPLALDLNAGYLRFLPLCPLWPGFAINTVFYAGVLWLLFAAPFALRRQRRIKRGLCPKCAYPVGESPVCTECGAAVACYDSVVKRRLRILGLFWALLVPSACTSMPAAPAAWNEVRLGMSQSEVRTELGDPADIHRLDSAEHASNPDEWCRTFEVFELPSAREIWLYWSGDEQALTVAFDGGGNVINYGQVSE